MKFKLIIDADKDEEVVVTAHNRTALIDEIEALISKHTDRIPGYTEDDIDTAAPADMDLYYSKEKQEKYGVVGIEIELI